MSPQQFEVTLTVTVDAAAYDAEYGDHGIENIGGAAAYATAVLAEWTLDALPSHLRPIVGITAGPLRPAPAAYADTILTTVRAGLAAGGYVTEHDRAPSAVTIGASDYEDGWFISARTALCRLYWTNGDHDEVDLCPDGLPDADEEALHDALAGFAGEVGPEAALLVDLRERTVEFNHNGRVYDARRYVPTDPAEIAWAARAAARAESPDPTEEFDPVALLAAVREELTRTGDPDARLVRFAATEFDSGHALDPGHAELRDTNGVTYWTRFSSQDVEDQLALIEEVSWQTAIVVDVVAGTVDENAKSWNALVLPAGQTA